MHAQRPSRNDHIYKVDKFVVPESARDEFMMNVGRIHQLLRQQPGFTYDLVLEKQSGPGTFNIVTLVAWQGADAMAGARTAVTEMNERTGFDPQELMARLGVTADVANYSEVPEPRGSTAGPTC